MNFFKKFLGPSQKKSIVLFDFRAATANFWSPLNNLVWIFGKSLYLTTSNIFFSNSKPRMIRSCNRDLRVDETHHKSNISMLWNPIKAILSTYIVKIVLTSYFVREPKHNYFRVFQLGKTPIEEGILEAKTECCAKD